MLQAGGMMIQHCRHAETPRDTPNHPPLPRHNQDRPAMQFPVHILDHPTADAHSLGLPKVLENKCVGGHKTRLTFQRKRAR